MKAFVVLVVLSFYMSVLNAQSLVWAKQFTGSGTISIISVAIDKSGNVYTTGRFDSIVDFDPGQGIVNITSIGSSDIFISKIDSTGNFLWVKQIGGKVGGMGIAIDTDDSGSVYCTGYFRDTVDFDPGPGSYLLAVDSGKYYNGVYYVPSSDVFIFKLDSSGNFIWARKIGAGGRDEPKSLLCYNSDYILVTGRLADGTPLTDTIDLDPGPGVFNVLGGGSYILKMDVLGNFIWAKKIGEYIGVFAIWNPTPPIRCIYTKDYSVEHHGLVVDESGNIYTTGWVNWPTDFDPDTGTYLVNPIGNWSDMFVCKMDSSGDLLWVKNTGGSESQTIGEDIDVDASGNVYVIGTFNDTLDSDPGSAMNLMLTTGLTDIFIMRFDDAGNQDWAGQIGGTDEDIGVAISTSASGDIYTTGYFKGTCDFDPGPGNFNVTSIDNFDNFVIKMGSNGSFQWAASASGVGSDYCFSIETDENGNVYTTGRIDSIADFDPGPGTVNLTSAGNWEGFIWKLSDLSTGIKDQFIQTGLSTVFPNPSADGWFRIINNELISEIIITNVVGEIVHQSNPFSTETTIQLTKTGVYFIQARTTGNKVTINKLIVYKK